MDENIVRDIATTLHTAFCPKHHDDEILSTLAGENEMCRWYVEVQCEDTWTLPDHMIWLLHAKILIKKIEESGNGDNVVDFITHMLKVCRNLIMMRNLSESGELHVMDLLSDFYSRE